MKVAALDLGTNTFLCLIAEIDAQRVLRVEKDLMQIVRLGQDLQKTGFFHVSPKCGCLHCRCVRVKSDP